MEWLHNNAIVQDIITLAKPALFNIYFAIASIPIGFPFAVLLAVMKNSSNGIVSRIARLISMRSEGHLCLSSFLCFIRSCWLLISVTGSRWA